MEKVEWRDKIKDMRYGGRLISSSCDGRKRWDGKMRWDVVNREMIK